MSLRILFVDDKKSPEEFGLEASECTVARTYAEAVRALRDQRWDVLYLDYFLRDNATTPNGEQVLRALRPEEIPPTVVGISADSSMRARVHDVADEIRFGGKATP